MVAWDMTDKDNPTPVVYCDGCGCECTDNGIELDGKHYCNRCIVVYTGYSMRGENYED